MAMSVERNPIIDELIACGLIPKDCYNAELHMMAGDVVRWELEIFMDESDFRKIADSLSKPEVAHQIVTDYIVKSRIRGEDSEGIEVKDPKGRKDAHD